MPKQSKAEIIAAIDAAASAYGADPDVLHGMARRESSYNPGAVNGSHVGLYQYDQSTWVERMRKYGTPDQQRVANGIQLKDKRALAYNDEQKGLLDLRADARTAANIQAQQLADEAAEFRRFHGREPTAAELYVPHLRGQKGGADILSADPGKPVAGLVPLPVYRANRGLFEPDGKPLTVGQFLQFINQDLARRQDQPSLAATLFPRSLGFAPDAFRKPLADYPDDPSPMPRRTGPVESLLDAQRQANPFSFPFLRRY